VKNKIQILLTNDDGFEAPGLWALKRELDQWGDCFVAAPHAERSASGHSVTLRGSIRVEERYEKNRLIGYAINGTPADCVKFAFSEHYKKKRPDLVVSGINPGPNTGVSVYYSGTIAAAREALMTHVPAFAVSVTEPILKGFGRFAKTALPVIQKTYKALNGSRFFYNINIPVKPARPKGVKVTHQSHSRFEEKFVPLAGKKAGTQNYFLSGQMLLLKETGMSDEEAIRSGYISLTPCQLDVSAYSEIEKLGKIFRRS
jgi:5'-nucleotidase